MITNEWLQRRRPESEVDSRTTNADVRIQSNSPSLLFAFVRFWLDPRSPLCADVLYE